MHIFIKEPRKNEFTRLVMITFSIIYAYHWEIIRIFVVKIWQIRKETPKTDPSLKLQNIGYPSYIVAKEVEGVSKGVA